MNNKRIEISNMVGAPGLVFEHGSVSTALQQFFGLVGEQVPKQMKITVWAGRRGTDEEKEALVTEAVREVSRTFRRSTNRPLDVGERKLLNDLLQTFDFSCWERDQEFTMRLEETFDREEDDDE